MKSKILPLLILLGSVAMGQSLSIVSVDSSKAYGNALISHDLEAHIDIRNTSNQSMDVLVKRLDGRGYNALTDSNAICWVLCFQTTVSVSPLKVTLGPGDTTLPGTFIGHVYPDGDDVSRKGPVTYVFYDMNNPNDSVAWTINYEVKGTLGVEEKSFDEFAVYPNPASDILKVKYSGMTSEGATFELVNMVGTKVYSRQLNNVDDEFKLDISKLSRGVYFYIIKSDGQVTTSKKLVIK